MSIFDEVSRPDTAVNTNFVAVILDGSKFGFVRDAVLEQTIHAILERENTDVCFYSSYQDQVSFERDFRSTFGEIPSHVSFENRRDFFGLSDELRDKYDNVKIYLEAEFSAMELAISYEVSNIGALKTVEIHDFYNGRVDKPEGTSEPGLDLSEI